MWKKVLSRIACALLFCSSVASAVDMGSFKPGSNTALPWKHCDINKCWEDLKPIVLYVYDPKPAKVNCAFHFETDLLVDPLVVDAIKDFHCVMVTKTDVGWPSSYLANAQKGAALLIMSCDAKPQVVYDNYAIRSKEEIINLAAALKQQNPVLAREMRLNPPKPFKNPNYKPGGGVGSATKDASDKEVAAMEKQEKDREEREKKAANLPGIKKDPDPMAAKKEEPKKEAPPDKKKTAELKDEE